MDVVFFFRVYEREERQAQRYSYNSHARSEPKLPVFRDEASTRRLDAQSFLLFVPSFSLSRFTASCLFFLSLPLSLSPHRTVTRTPSLCVPLSFPFIIIFVTFFCFFFLPFAPASIFLFRFTLFYSSLVFFSFFSSLLHSSFFLHRYL